MKKSVYISTTLIVALLFFSACSFKQYDPETMYKKGAHLTKLTKKAQVAVRKDIVKNKDLYDYVNINFSRSLSHFSEYSILMKNDNGVAVVLMCDKNATKALLEDIACTSALDANDLFEKELVCDFHLDTKTKCGLQ